MFHVHQHVSRARLWCKRKLAHRPAESTQARTKPVVHIVAVAVVLLFWVWGFPFRGGNGLFFVGGVLLKIENTPFLVLPPKASDGFLKTGDLATIDAGGYCTITGRQKDTIIRGGENIAPSEVEAVLRRHRSVFDVSLVGVRQLRHNCCPLHASRSSAPPRTPHVACATCAHSHWCPDADHAWPAIRCHARFTVLDLGLVHVMLDSRS